MISSVILLPAVLEDICAGATWYKEQEEGLGGELADEIFNAFRRAQANSGLFPIVRARDGLRRVFTERFPYRVYFTVKADTLYVHAVMHGAQSERRLRGR